MTLADASDYSSHQYSDDFLDEVRISNTARSDDWISTEYHNQSSPATFYSVGPENAPFLRSLAPVSGSPGVSVTMSGLGFGATVGTVTFNGQTASISSWSDTSIVAVVPSGAASGPVVVSQGGVQSNSMPFAIFAYQRALVISHSQVTNTDQTNFPVLISGTYSSLATVANGGRVQNPNGYDIIFTSDAAGNSKLDHEIESYDPVTGTVNFWVRIPTLSHTADTFIYMQYGSSAITASLENKSGVWQAGYQSVYHFGSASALGADSGSAGYGLSQSGPVGAVSGKIGGGISFNGTSTNYLNRSSVSAYPGGSSAVTLETWIQASGNPNGEVVGYGDNSTSNGRAAIFSDGAGKVYMEFDGSNINASYRADGRWHHVVGVYGGGTSAQLYLDGAQVAASTTVGPLSLVATEFKIGGIPTVTCCNAFTGSVDEVRVISGALSSDWVAAEYHNQNSPATFYDVGPENASFITSLSPSTGSPGVSVTISGVGFGAIVGTVTFNGQTASIANWSDTSIVAVVPSGATSGPVVVSQGGVQSNSPTFAIFTNHRALVIDHAKVPNTDQANFPVLVSGTYSYLATVANGGKVQSPNGYDIIFSTDIAGANKLDHEIESYDPVTGAINFWVRVPALSHTAATVIYMKYGSSNVGASLENKAGVWDANYQMVLHLGESAAPYNDSTSNSFSSTGGTSPTRATGKIGQGQSFDGTSQYIAYSQGQSPNPNVNITLETWIKTTETAVKGVFGKWGTDGVQDPDQSYVMYYANGVPAAVLNSTDATDVAVTSTMAINDGSWHHLVVTAPPSGNISFYTDGVQTGSLNNSHPLLATTIDRLIIGGHCLACGTYLMNGLLDEVRISNSVRAADWVATEYNNQSSPATFFSIAGENSGNIVVGLAPTGGPPSTSVTISGQGFGASAGTVTFNGQAATVSNWSDTSIVVVVPDGASTGPVVVTNGSGPSNGLFFTVLQPTITALSPESSEPEVSVTITGANFGATAGAVTFNGQSVAITSWSDTSIAVTVPASATSGNVVVSNRGLQSAGVPFTVLLPTINSLSPASGDPGITVTIAGSHFGTVAGIVNFNGLAIVVTSWNATNITAQVPNGAGSGNVVVTSSLGRSSNGAAFNVTDNLAVTLFSPTNGSVGTQVTITGGGFGATQGSSAVQFNGVTAAIISWSDTQIIAGVPAGAASGPIFVNVPSTGFALSASSFMITTTVQIMDSLNHVSSYTSTNMGGEWEPLSATGSGCSSCTIRGNVQSSFDINGNTLSFTDELGHVTNYTYDANNNITSQSALLNANTAVTTSYTYNSFGEPLTVTDPLGNTTTNTYDANGNLLTVMTPAPNSSTPASVTQFAYNPNGELTQITDPLNHVTTLTYTTAGLIATITDAQQNVTTYQYDTHGNRTAVIDALQHQTSFAYDAMDRLTAITYPDQTTAGFGYDSRGRRTSVTDQNGKVTTYTYDDADRLTQVKDAANNVTQYAYDTEDNLLSITDANGHTTSFAYDAFGRAVQITFPSTLTETYLYDAAGNLVSRTDRNGHSILYVYDALYRLAHKGYPDATGVDYVYDLAGKVKQVSDPTGSYGMAYDNMGRLVGTTTQYLFLPGSPAPTFSNSYAYDAASNRTQFTAPDGSTNTYQYDTLNRQTTLTSSLAGQFTFSYDVLGRRTGLNRPNAVNTTYGYDSLSRLLSVLHQSGGATMDGASYIYDNVGNRTTKTNKLNNIAEQYVYDAIYQLQQVTQGATTTESYTYDAVGNRLSSLSVPSYSYNPSNELTSATGLSYTYDSNGNTLSKTSAGATTQYAWDFESRLNSVVLPGSGGTVTFKYDPFGRRIQKISPSGTTNYVYDGVNVIEEINSTGPLVTRYTQNQGVDAPLAQLRSGTSSYYEQDGLGSITSLSTSSTSLANTYTYDSFGNFTNSSGTAVNSFQYTGRDYDPETGLQYYRARYYDPAVGRFLSADPIGFSGGMNPYNYVDGDPISRIDPLGLDWIEYTGQTLTVWPGKFKDRGHPPLLQCKASSGLPSHQTPANQNDPDAGPVHEGHYWINLALDPHRWAGFYRPTNELAAAYGVQRIRPEYTLSDGRIGYPTGWGTWRARLQPLNVSTARGNFYLHNSTKGFTHGCVETCDSLYDKFVKYHDQGLHGIDVLVDYTTNSTNGGTLVP